MMIDKLLKKAGTDAAFIDNATATTVNFYAVVEPLRYKNKIYLRGTYTEIGRNHQDFYLYIGPPDVDISDTDSITKVLIINGVSYVVDRAENHAMGNKNIYMWAIIRPVVAEPEE